MIIVHRNVNLQEIREWSPESFDEDMAGTICLCFMAEGWENWPEKCSIELVCYLGHKLNGDGTADVFMRISDPYMYCPEWDIEGYVKQYGAEVYSTSYKPLPSGLDYSYLGLDGR